MSPSTGMEMLEKEALNLKTPRYQARKKNVKKYLKSEFTSWSKVSTVFSATGLISK